MSIPNFSIEGKVTIVTGASRGIGNALAKGFAEAGARIALVARTVSQLEAAAQEIQAKGGTAIVVPTDVTQQDQVNAMVERTLREWERIDVLLNVAGGAGDIYELPTLEMTQEYYEELHLRNLKSVFLVNQAVARVMVKQKEGSIINVSSTSGIRPVPLETVVGAFKAGVNQMTRAMATDIGPHKVRVNAIAPGLTLTERVKKKLGAEFIEQHEKGIPLRRAAQPEDHLGPALFFASDAAAYITGNIMTAAGGPY